MPPEAFGPPRLPFAGAEAIRAAERDRALELDVESWPSSPGPALPTARWQRSDIGFARVITSDDSQEGKRSRSPPPVDLKVPIHETILRFPSAPIYGLQRHVVHHHPQASQGFHTLRLLRSEDPKHRQRPGRYVLMHTGLNETYKMGLYYRLAALLIKADPTTVCILRPFPGHFTRFPFEKYSETPLDRYLWDGSQLFRQFLRFMIETQWLLSALVRRSSYRCASGVNLLAETNRFATSRLTDSVLAREMCAAWQRLYESSNCELPAGQQEYLPSIPTVSSIEGSIRALRDAVDWDNLGRHTGRLSERFVEPAFHVLGYSLGGFTAQSVFMSWPFVIASCSTLLAGGPLRDLAPSTFAHPEEWQTVLHSLRYELDDLLETRAGDAAGKGDSAFGLGEGLFPVFKRVFYEVFQQEYRGSYQTRLEAFRDRMLFVVGGNDPVVTPRSVLDSAPEGGLNLLEIGGLGHFLGAPSGKEDHGAEQEFWLPEVGALVHRFAGRTEDTHRAEQPLCWFDLALDGPALSSAEWNAKLAAIAPSSRQGRRRPVSESPSLLRPHEEIAIDREGALPAALFERCMDDLLARVGGQGGALFILRNEVPTFLLPPFAVREVATARYHDDADIARSCHAVAARRAFIESKDALICVVLPWNAYALTRAMDRDREHPSQSETAGAPLSRRPRPSAELWTAVEASCRAIARKHPGSVREFNGRKSLIAWANEDKEHNDKLRGVVQGEARGIEHVAALPDCWLWFSNGWLGWDDSRSMCVDDAIGALKEHAKKLEPDDVSKAIGSGGLRIVTVSRARFNPRFRGRLLVSTSEARRVLIHAVTCVAMSTPRDDLGSEAGE